MTNINTYNSTSFWSWQPLGITLQDDIAINGFWLQNEYFFTHKISESNKMDISTFDTPRRDGKGLLWYYKRGKAITLDLTIRGDNEQDFRDKLDQLRKNIFQEEIYLDWRINGIIRRIKVICNWHPLVFQNYNISFIRTTIKFITVEPFWYNIGYQSQSFIWKTASFFSTLENDGTDVTDPLVSLLFKTGLSGVDTISFNIWDDTVTLNETINDNDVVEINGETKEILINSVIKDYSGVFPEMVVWTSVVDFAINWTFTVDIIIINRKNYV